MPLPLRRHQQVEGDAVDHHHGAEQHHELQERAHVLSRTTILREDRELGRQVFHGVRVGAPRPTSAARSTPIR
jgi:hypothetical protein